MTTLRRAIVVMAFCGFILVFSGSVVAESPSAPDGGRSPGGFDPKWLDTSAKPCEDFFQYACGSWLRLNPIPPEFSRWGRFDELSDRNRNDLKVILEKAAASPGNAGSARQKIGDYYASCMDEARAEKDGLGPVEPLLGRIGALKDAAGAVREAARFRREGLPALFTFDSTLDARNSAEVIAEADQGGLGLPDRDYYTKEDDKSKTLREGYVAHVTKMFTLAGDTPEAAAKEAARVMALETALASGSQTRVERRDPEKLYNRMTLAQLQELAPSLPWAGYFKEAGLVPVASINIVSPGYFKALDERIKGAAVEDWKSYLRWVVLHGAAPRLSSAFVDENFRFFGATLTGAKVLQPRWKRCVAATDAGLRDLLGQPYVEATFGADGKKRMDTLVSALLAAMDDDLSKVSWMDDETRVKAKQKLAAIARKIGYPDKWVDMSKLAVERGSWQANFAGANWFRFDRELAKVGKPFDRTEWTITVPTVNAGYNPQLNDVTFPAGILQPPFFDRKADDAINYGAIGGGIGHEITHGFDDQGRQFDKDGNLKDWWTTKAASEFTKRAACVERQFSDYTAVDDLKLNGQLTLGENIADLGGLKIAWAAFRGTPEGKAGSAAEALDGFTPDQRFFLGWSQVWCEGSRPEQSRLLVNVDPHSPGKFRVNGPLSNMKEFRVAFTCPEDAPMVRKVSDLCEVW